MLYKKGTSGTIVAEIQQALREFGFESIAADGIFGAKTEEAVKAFQRNHNLSPDGIVGPNTWRILFGTEIVAPKPTKYDDPSLWMNIAWGELARGVAEVPGSGDSPRVLEYLATGPNKYSKDSIAWCSTFPMWVFRQAGIAVPVTVTESARSWLGFGVSIANGRYGSVAVFSRSGGNHVGFFVDEDPYNIYLLGGNQSDRVSVCRYSKANLIGNVWPR